MDSPIPKDLCRSPFLRRGIASANGEVLESTSGSKQKGHEAEARAVQEIATAQKSALSVRQ